MNSLEVLHSRYAQALFEHARECDIQEEIKSEYEMLCSTLEEHPQYKKIFLSPYFTRKEKIELLDNLNKHLNFNRAFTSFLKLLIEENRFSLIGGIFLRYKDLYAKEKGILRVIICSAVGMTEFSIEKLKSALQRRFKKEIEIKNIIDKALLGGLKIEIEGKLTDLSLRGRLENIKESVVL